MRRVTGGLSQDTEFAPRPYKLNPNTLYYTVSVLSAHCRTFSDTPKTAATTSTLMPVDQPPVSDTTEYESTLDDIIKQVERSVYRSEAELFRFYSLK